MIVAVDCGGVVRRPVFLGVVGLAVMPRRADQSPGIFAVSQGDAVFVHVHGRHVSTCVRVDGNFYFLPILTVVLTSIDRQRSGRVAILGERQNVSIGLIDGQATSLKGRLGDDDLLSPGFTTIFTATGEKLFVSQGGKNSPFESDDDIGVAYGLEEWLNFHTWLAQEGIHWALQLSGLIRRVDLYGCQTSHEHKYCCRKQLSLVYVHYCVEIRSSMPGPFQPQQVGLWNRQKHPLADFGFCWRSDH